MISPRSEHVNISTDDTLYESISHGSIRYPFSYYLEDVWQFDFHCIDWHWHHELEFMSVTRGVVTVLVGENRLELPEGSGLFVNSGILHRYESIANNLMPNIVFSPTLLAAEGSLLYEKYIHPVISSDISYHILTPETDWQGEILRLLSAIYHLQEQDGRNELSTTRLLLKMWEILYNHLDLSTDVSGLHHINHRQAQLQIMMQYIHDHYSEPITLEKIADTASISKSSALNIFQSCIHTSPVSYLIQYRLTCAAQLLYTTEKPVSVISQETGFSSAGYFCRKFKELYGMTPNEYRREK